MGEKKTITEQTNQKSLEKTLPTVAKAVDAIVDRWQFLGDIIAGVVAGMLTLVRMSKIIVGEKITSSSR